MSKGDTLKRAGDVANFIFDHEDGIPMAIKKEMKREIKTEPVDGAEKVQKESNSNTLKRAGDIANFIDMGTVEDQSKTRHAWILSCLTFEIFKNI